MGKQNLKKLKDNIRKELYFKNKRGRIFSEEYNPEGFYPSDDDTEYEAAKMFKSKWNYLGSKEQQKIIDKLINEMYQGVNKW